MTANGWIQIGLFCLAVIVCVKPLGLYMARLFDGERTFLSPVLGPVERGIYQLCGIKPDQEQHWTGYTIAMLAFSIAGFVSLYLMQRLQAVLPFNPQGMAGTTPDLSSWLDACDGSARCSAACPEGINVRQWISIAKLKAAQAMRPADESAAAAASRFRRMAQSVRLLASMQLPSETLKRILAPAEKRTADVLFYTGCNVLRTPHIVLNVMDILDALDLDFDVVGGTTMRSACGRITLRSVMMKCRPSEAAASNWPFGTASIPERNTSAE